MIDLVLDGAGEKPGRFDPDFFAFERLRLHFDRNRSFDIRTDFRKTEAAFASELRRCAQAQLGIQQNQRHLRREVLHRLPVEIHRARPVFDLGNIDDRELEGVSHLLGREADSVRSLHSLEHVRRERPNVLVYLQDLFPFCSEDRVAVFPNGQLHFPSRVNAGRFFTPASFNASITLMMVPNDAFLSACNAIAAFRFAGRFLTEPSSSSTPMTWPSSRTSSVSLTLTTECSNSEEDFVEVLESGRLI